MSATVDLGAPARYGPSVTHRAHYLYDRPLAQGELVARYKRFLADVRLRDGSVITAHCPNSGSMRTCAEAGRPVLVSDSGDAKRKLRYTWESIHMGEAHVGIHSALSNRIVAQWVQEGHLPELAPAQAPRREVRYGPDGRSRVDLLLDAQGTPHYVEIKHSTMRVGCHAAFPDAVTQRGLKHLEDLAHVVRQGARATLVLTVGRADCTRFRPADEIDPLYGKALRDVAARGVRVLALGLELSLRGAHLVGELPVDLS